MEEQLLPIVSSGKYAGKSITELMSDQWYIDNVLKKEESKVWFNSSNKKWGPIYNIIVNQSLSTNKDGKTPEHNRLQNMFLENDIITNLGNIIINKYSNNKRHKPLKLISYKIEFEGKFNWDCIINTYFDFQCLNGRGCCSNEFDEGKILVFIEIKPILGDDYPCVLRKMKSQIELTKNAYKKEHGVFSIYILVVKKYDSDSTSKENLIKIFKQTNIIILFTDELINTSPIQIITEKVKQLEFTNTQEEIINLEEKNRLLQEKLLQSEEIIKQLEKKNKLLEEEIQTLKTQKQNKSIKDYYFGKK